MSTQLEKIWAIASHPNTPDAEALSALRMLARKTRDKRAIFVDWDGSFFFDAESEAKQWLFEDYMKHEMEMSKLQVKLHVVIRAETALKASLASQSKRHAQKVAALEAELEALKTTLSATEHRLESARASFADAFNALGMTTNLDTDNAGSADSTTSALTDTATSATDAPQTLVERGRTIAQARQRGEPFPAEFRDIVVTLRGEGWTYAALSEGLGCSQGTIRNIIYER